MRLEPAGAQEEQRPQQQEEVLLWELLPAGAEVELEGWAALVVVVGAEQKVQEVEAA